MTRFYRVIRKGDSLGAKINLPNIDVSERIQDTNIPKLIVKQRAVSTAVRSILSYKLQNRKKQQVTCSLRQRNEQVLSRATVTTTNVLVIHLEELVISNDWKHLHPPVLRQFSIRNGRRKIYPYHGLKPIDCRFRGKI